MIKRLIYICTLSFPFSSAAQLTGSKNVILTLPTVALLDIEPAGLINMNFTAPTEAGSPLVNPTPNTSKWLNYTSAIAAAGSNRIITASISKIVPGIDIKLSTASAAMGGGGALGTPSGQIILTTIAQTIVSGIGGAYTGNGANFGHQLTLTISPNNYATLSSANSTSIIIRYTISD
ncbi:hypothetical protein ACLCDV_07670 [Sphingobacterium sp. Lzh-3]|uniref:hypothetical protein n=1 Tax=unclassified Sphingobacterium TaxID=2609468 RepID=UPI002953A275|nr:hypothetical protein [Sphingobacterium sp. UGAL515B_05]WON94831.1 hypothetical protein OK025_00115 [Sphingobacterium sp. UGAL515B_05]